MCSKILCFVFLIFIVHNFITNYVSKIVNFGKIYCLKHIMIYELLENKIRNNTIRIKIIRIIYNIMI